MAALPRHELYALEDTEAAERRLDGQFQRVLAQLPSFAAASARLSDPFPKEQPLPDARPAEKPVPVPISLAALLLLVQRQLELGPEWARLPSRPQATFRDIILREVRRVFKDLQDSLYDPAFSAQTNRELYRSLVAYLGLVSRHLFLHYLRLMERRSRLRVFTDCANLTRFSAQLTLDCSAFFNVATVRHHQVMEMKTACSRWPALAHEPCIPLAHLFNETLRCRLGFNMNYFIWLSGPHVPTVRNKVAEDIKELEHLPSLDMNKIKQLNLPKPKEITSLKKMTCSAVRIPCPSSSREKVKSQHIKQAASSVLTRTQTLPNLRSGQLLTEEPGITPRPLSPDLPCHYTETAEDGDLRGPACLAEDLQRLVQGCTVEDSQWQAKQNEEELELPPLIRALTRRKANELHQEHLNNLLKALKLEEDVERKRRNTIISAPASHPQATTINFKVHDKMVVKLADLQVSERVLLEPVELEKYKPIYNHLLGEINSATLKSLDASLSTGEEVRELYKELMSIIPEDHLKFDVGPLIESPAVNIDLTGYFASSSLTRRKSEQVINEELNKILPAGPYSPEEVVDTAQTPNLPFKMEGSKKEYTSWLKWWKRTFSTDEYLKYIGNKDSDYLAVIFHLYSSLTEEEEEKKFQQPVLDEAEIKAQVKLKMEVIKKPAVLQPKVEFATGFSQSITMEGMGTPGVSDPKLDHVKVWQEELGTVVGSEYKHEDLEVLQRRLERLWMVLHFSERERLDMAIKYSSHPFYLLLPDMLQAWEEAARSIQDRELLLAELEKFEQTASDPNRLFSLDPRAYAKRAQECRTRNRLHSELAQYNSELYVILTHIKEVFNDTVTFKGHPYLEKMEWDTMEMLYWLQQERRASALSKAVQRGKLPPLR